MVRRLSSQTFSKYVHMPANAKYLNNGELKALVRAVNHKASDVQADQIVTAFEGCSIETERGTLIGLESQNCMLNGSHWILKFKQR